MGYNFKSHLDMNISVQAIFVNILMLVQFSSDLSLTRFFRKNHTIKINISQQSIYSKNNLKQILLNKK